MAELTKLKEVRCRPAKIPTGEYNGIWSGYVVKFMDKEGIEYEGRTSQGIRGRAPCRVLVTEDGVDAELNI